MSRYVGNPTEAPSHLIDIFKFIKSELEDDNYITTNLSVNDVKEYIDDNCSQFNDMNNIDILKLATDVFNYEEEEVEEEVEDVVEVGFNPIDRCSEDEEDTEEEDTEEEKNNTFIEKSIKTIEKILSDIKKALSKK